MSSEERECEGVESVHFSFPGGKTSFLGSDSYNQTPSGEIAEIPHHLEAIKLPPIAGYPEKPQQFSKCWTNEIVQHGQQMVESNVVRRHGREFPNMRVCSVELNEPLQGNLPGLSPKRLSPIVNVSDFVSAMKALSIHAAQKGKGHEGVIPNLSVTDESDNDSLSFIAAEDETIPDGAQWVVVASQDFLTEVTKEHRRLAEG